MASELQLRLKKKNAIIIANNFQEKADKWFKLASEYNNQIIDKWLKKHLKKTHKETEAK